MSSANSLPAVPLDPEVHKRLLVEAYRRAAGATDIRDAMRAIAEQALAPVLAKLGAEDLDAQGRPVPQPPPPAVPSTGPGEQPP